jgi:hypothetical protein
MGSEKSLLKRKRRAKGACERCGTETWQTIGQGSVKMFYCGCLGDRTL